MSDETRGKNEDGKLLYCSFCGNLELFTDDVVAQLDAFVADEHRWTRDQLPHLVLAFAAKRTVQGVFCIATF